MAKKSNGTGWLGVILGIGLGLAAVLLVIQFVPK